MQLADQQSPFVGRLLHYEIVWINFGGIFGSGVIGGILCGQFHRRGSNKSDVLELWLADYWSMNQSGFVA